MGVATRDTLGRHELVERVVNVLINHGVPLGKEVSVLIKGFVSTNRLVCSRR